MKFYKKMEKIQKMLNNITVLYSILWEEKKRIISIVIND